MNGNVGHTRFDMCQPYANLQTHLSILGYSNEKEARST